MVLQDKFQIIESSRHLKLYGFVVETMQRLYRLWKTRLHYYYKSAKCGKTYEERLKNPPPDLPQDQWESCVKHFGSAEFKVLIINTLTLFFFILLCLIFQITFLHHVDSQ